MPFLTADDYQSQIKAENLTAMIGEDDTIRVTAEAEAISQVRTYLVELYDVDSIFAQTGEQRHPHLLRICKDIVLYILHQRLPKRIMPDHIQANYADCLKFLESVADGKIALELPRKTDSEAKPKTRFRWGGQTARSYDRRRQ